MEYGLLRSTTENPHWSAKLLCFRKKCGEQPVVTLFEQFSKLPSAIIKKIFTRVFLQTYRTSESTLCLFYGPPGFIFEY